jgi:hypothetical protein
MSSRTLTFDDTLYRYLLACDVSDEFTSLGRPRRPETTRFSGADPRPAARPETIPPPAVACACA